MPRSLLYWIGDHLDPSCGRGYQWTVPKPISWSAAIGGFRSSFTDFVLTLIGRPFA